jgi:hypothetical protein
MAVVKLNEAMLFQMGFDRVAIDALRHLYTQVGSEVGAPTLPQVVEGVTTIIEKVDYLDLSPPSQSQSQDVVVAAVSSDFGSMPPPYQQAEMQDLQSPPASQERAIEYLETQIRGALEQITILERRINDLEQGAIL